MRRRLEQVVHLEANHSAERLDRPPATFAFLEPADHLGNAQPALNFELAVNPVPGSANRAFAPPPHAGDYHSGGWSRTQESPAWERQRWSPTSISVATREGRRRLRRAPRCGSTGDWCGPMRFTTRRRSGASSARSSTTRALRLPIGGSPTRSGRTTTSSGWRSTRSISWRRSRGRATRSRPRARARPTPRRSSGRSSRRSGAATRPTTRRPTSSRGTPTTPMRCVPSTARIPTSSTSRRCSPMR